MTEQNGHHSSSASSEIQGIPPFDWSSFSKNPRDDRWSNNRFWTLHSRHLVFSVRREGVQKEPLFKAPPSANAED